MSKQKVAIGIDPGTKTGFAVLDIATGTFIEVSTLRIDEALFKAVDYLAEYECYFIAEDARKRKWYNDEALSASRKKGRWQGSGSIRRDSSIWEDFLTARGAVFKMEPPKRGTTKYDAAYFKRLTGWQKVTSEHGRDAALKVWGVNPRNLKLLFPKLPPEQKPLTSFALFQKKE